MRTGINRVAVLLASSIATATGCGKDTTAAQTVARWELAGSLPTPAHILTMAPVGLDAVWAFCATGDIYLSTDGGATWRLRSTGLPRVGMIGTALDTLRVWAVASDASNPDTRVYRSQDGGRTWELAETIAGCRWCGGGVHMFSDTGGVLIADPSSPGASFSLRHTRDGGRSWQPAPTPPRGRAQEYVIGNAWDAVDEQHVWFATGIDDPQADGVRIFRTTTGADGEWSFATVSSITPLAQRRIVNAIAFVDRERGLLASYGRDVLRTTNGGVSWTPIVPPGPAAWRSLAMSGAKDGSGTIRLLVADDAAGQARIFRTEDLGATWLEESVPPDRITHLAFRGPATGYAGTDLGHVYRYRPAP